MRIVLLSCLLVLVSPLRATATEAECIPTPAPAAAPVPANDPSSCVQWQPGTVYTNTGTLNTLLLQNTCVFIPEGIHPFHERITLPSGRILKGAGRDKTILLAVGEPGYPWISNTENGCANIPADVSCTQAMMKEQPGFEGFIETDGPASHDISDLTIDAGYRATLGLSIRDTTVSRVRVLRATCDGITASGIVSITDSIIEDNGKYCLTGLGAAGIYTQHASAPEPVNGSTAPVNVYPATYPLEIKRNYIRKNWGGALDVNAVWWGVLEDNIIECNRLKTSVSLFAASHWRIIHNKIEHPANSGYKHADDVHGHGIELDFNAAGYRGVPDGQGGTTYVENNEDYRYCSQVPDPAHPGVVKSMDSGAGLVLCQLYDDRTYTQGFKYNDVAYSRLVTHTNFVSTYNTIYNNRIQGPHGIMSLGADCDREDVSISYRSCTSTTREYWAPRFNTFQSNDVSGSGGGCLDDFPFGQWLYDTNTWTGNNCAGPANTPPTYF